MKWIKKGLIFAPSGQHDWLVTHAALPVPMPVDDDRFRIYCSGRDREGRSQIGYFEVSLCEPGRALRVSARPCLAAGPLGAFDDHGVTSSWIVAHEGRLFNYYTGWTLGVTVPFYFYVGLAISDDGGETFHRVSLAPVLERNEVDPYLTASPCVLIDHGVWRMWYISGVRWEMCGGKPVHYYHVKYAESSDGLHWRRDGRVCLDFQAPDEHAFARPCVIKDGDCYRMWYSLRGARYRIGYAESPTGLQWERRDAEAGIATSPVGWDSEMIEYPFVFDHRGQRYMLYNGNGYGRTGVGLAALAADDGRDARLAS